MTISRFSLIVLSTALLTYGAHAVWLDRLQQKTFEKLLFLAEKCGFSKKLIKMDRSGERGKDGQVVLGGQYLDCSVDGKDRQLGCLENELTQSGISFRGPSYRGNCTYVPPVP